MDADDPDMFRLLKSIGNARLGVLSLPGRTPIKTPHYIATTSRGVVPHLSQDTFRSTQIEGVLIALEDFIEKKEPPILNFAKDRPSPLRRFTALPDASLLVLSARRTPAVSCPQANTDSEISVITSVGFRRLSVQEHGSAVGKLRPDIVVALGDMPFGATQISRRRKEKMTDRTRKWVGQQVDMQRFNNGPALFAPILPVESEAQKWYIEELVDRRSDIAGLAIYDSTTDLPPDLKSLPKLGLTTPSTPHQVLKEISLGIDLSTIPFIGAATDAGISLNFHFPSTPSEDTPAPLGIDMWQTVHSTSLDPLDKSCDCYACTRHHRAYIQHLLSAKEMLGWVLLQIHNHRTMDRFFEGVRRSIEKETFETDCAAFARCYESELPEKTGSGPRVRGYQYRSEGPSESKRNPAGFKMLDSGKEMIDESSTPPQVSAQDLQKRGFAERSE